MPALRPHACRSRWGAGQFATFQHAVTVAVEHPEAIGRSRRHFVAIDAAVEIAVHHGDRLGIIKIAEPRRALPSRVGRLRSLPCVGAAAITAVPAATAHAATPHATAATAHAATTVSVAAAGA